MTTNIYILKLKQGKYYIGKSDDPHKRFIEHVEGRGAYWTKKYEPLELERIIENASPFDEDKYTKEYMSIHGIENVRGGSYTSETLTADQIRSCQTEIWAAHDLCFRCGGNHFIKDCPQPANEISASCSYFQQVVNFFSNAFKKEPKTVTCSRCGRNNHLVGNCYASRDIEGHYITSRQKCDRCGRTNHLIKNCYAKTDIRGEYIPIE